MRFCFLKYFRDEMIATQHAPCWIEKHQVGRSIFKRKRRKRLQRQSESRFTQNRSRAAPLEVQTQVSVAANPFNIPFRILFRIQRARSGGSIR